MTTWVVDVGWTSVRPVVVDQHWSRVTVEAETWLDAELAAVAMVTGLRSRVAWRPQCEMVTRTVILV